MPQLIIRCCEWRANTLQTKLKLFFLALRGAWNSAIEEEIHQPKSPSSILASRRKLSAAFDNSFSKLIFEKHDIFMERIELNKEKLRLTLLDQELTRKFEALPKLEDSSSPAQEEPSSLLKDQVSGDARSDIVNASTSQETVEFNDTINKAIERQKFDCSDRIQQIDQRLKELEIIEEHWTSKRDSLIVQKRENEDERRSLQLKMFVMEHEHDDKDFIKIPSKKLPNLAYLLPGVAAALYIFGLVIVNLNLARHGIYEVELARPQYIIVGTLWAFLTGLGFVWLYIGFLIIKEARSTKIDRSATRWIYLLFLTGWFCYLAYGFIWQPLQHLTEGFDIVPVIVLYIMNEVMVGLTMIGIVYHTAGFGGWLLPFSLSIDKFVAVVWRDMKPRTFMLLVAAPSIMLPTALWQYSCYLFPYISKTYGGGRPIRAFITLKEPLTDVHDPSIWTSSDGLRIGPVGFLSEMEYNVAIASLNSPDSPAILINKDLIKTVVVKSVPRVMPVLIVDPSLRAQIFDTSKETFRTLPTSATRYPLEKRSPITANVLHDSDGDSLIVMMGFCSARNSLDSTVYGFSNDGNTRLKQYFLKGPEFDLTNVANISPPRMQHTATVVDNSIVVAGGMNEKGIPISSVIILELDENDKVIVRPTRSLCVPRCAHTATKLRNSDEILVAGGRNAKNNEVETCEVYNVPRQTFEEVGQLIIPRIGHTATLLKNGLVLVAGGKNQGKIIETSELYDPENRTFRPTASMTVPRSDACAVLLLDGTVLFAGGTDQYGPSNCAEIFDSTNNTFTRIAGMLESREGHSAVMLQDGSVLIVGGHGRRGERVMRAEIFDPWKREFREIERTRFPIDNAQAIQLSSVDFDTQKTKTPK